MEHALHCSLLFKAIVNLTIQCLTSSMAANFAAIGSGCDVTLWWLGQAGFAIRAGGSRILIDPYLSDSLAQKYAGTRFPHIRMMPPPLTVDQLPPLDWVLCTHAHSDHMDPGTLTALAASQPLCRFVVPRAEKAKSMQRGLPPDRTVLVNAGEHLALADGLELDVLPSAHEHLCTNDAGEHHYLGFVLDLGGTRIYHSGDAAPFPGWISLLRQQRIDVALLPVNGRDEQRRCNGIPGNTTLEEALALCRESGIAWMIAHHFGMFDFNTVDVAVLTAAAAQSQSPRCIVPDVTRCLVIQQ